MAKDGREDRRGETPFGEATFDEDTAGDDPFALFGRWYEEAGTAAGLEGGGAMAEAMALATVGADGRPSVRMVLLKSWDHSGFVFFTNYASRKAEDLDAHPDAALLFHWPSPHRQVRIEGPASKLPAPESDAYFATRPRGSQLSAHASDQSRPVADRATVAARFARVAEQYGSGSVPRPDGWGGYRLAPVAFEFWQGRPDRLHDRLAYRRPLPASRAWTRERLQP